MKRLAIALGLLLANQPVSAIAEDVPALIARIIPPGAETALRGIGEENGLVKAEGATIRVPGVDIGLRGVAVADTGDGGLIISADQATLAPHLDAAPRISVGGLKVVMTGRPDFFSQDAMCSWIDRIAGVAVEAAKIEIRDPARDGMARVGITELKGASYSARETRGACSLDGELVARGLAFSDGSGRVIGADGFSVNMRLPASVDAAARSVDRAFIAMRANQVEARNAEEIPAVNVLGFEMRALADPGGLRDMIAVLRMTNPFTYRRPAPFLAMQVYNASISTDIVADFSVEHLRLHAAGVIPVSFLSDFSRSDMNTVSGSFGLKIRFRDGKVTPEAFAQLSGIGRIDLTTSLELMPFGRDWLDAAARSEPMGLDAFPLIIIDGVDLTMLDQGFSSSVLKLVGRSAKAQLLSFYESIASQSAADWLRSANAGISSFFDAFSDGARTSVLIEPGGSASVLDIAAAMIGDPGSLSGIVSIRQEQP